MSDRTVKPVLYSYFRSSASWRVRIALALKEISYEYKAVNLLKSQQVSEDFSAVNPMTQVPALVIDGQTLTQSIAILEYLEETYPGRANILPKQPIERAQARMIAEIINSGMQPLQNLSVLNMVAEWTESNEKKMEWAKTWIEKGFAAVERILEKTAKKYCVGDEISIADICLVPQFYNGKRFKVDLSAYPNVFRVHGNLICIPAFMAADPVVQPDCPEDIRNA